MDAAEAERARLLVVHETLCATYGCPIAFFSDKDPLAELVSALLSHRTKNADSGRAYRALVAQLPTWDAVADAPVEAIEAAIAAATWPEQKAPRIRHALRYVRDSRGTLSLDFLAAMPVNEARAWLEKIPGVGPKTSAAVLLFSSLRRPALPVDTHHYRVAQRLGFVPPKMGEAASHAHLEGLLPEGWSAQQVYDHHEALMLHGQKCCFYYNPACERCPVLKLCPTGLQQVAKSA